MPTPPPAAPPPSPAFFRRKRSLACGVVLGLFLPACVDTPAGPAPLPMPMSIDPPPPPKLVWEKSAPPTSALRFAQAGRGLKVARGIIHLHSVYSHDACDGNPQSGGKINEPCLRSLRRALCTSRQDFAMLTDHATHMTEPEWDRLFLIDGAAGDEPEKIAGELVANALHCGSEAPNHKVLVTVGGENDLMPVGLRHPMGATEAERKAAMTAESPKAVMDFHAAGGAVFVPHGESRTIELLRMLAGGGLDGMEIYNLHANIDPRIRETYLGLPGVGAFAGLAPWLAGRPVSEGGPEPDLAVLGFLEENKNQLGKFETLLGEGYRLLPIFGSDAHENSFKQLLADEERGDSYRRLMRWFTNHLLLADGPVSYSAVREAIAKKRGYSVFEVFGQPVGFDFYARGSGPTAATTFELGEEAPLGATLHAQAPRPFFDKDRSTDKLLRMSVVRVAPMGKTGEIVKQLSLSAAELAAEPGPSITVDTAASGPGAYRVEIRVVPLHLLHLLGEDPSMYRKEYPYLYSSPIYVK